MNYWVHRIASHKPIESVFFLEKKVLVTGYSDLANETFLKNVLNTTNEDERKAIVGSEMETHWGKAYPRKTPILLRFLHGFKKGDWVLLPLWTEFGIYELVSDKPSIIGDLEGSPFVAKTGKESSQKEGTFELRDGKLHKEDEVIDLGFYWKVKPIVAWKLKADYWSPALKRRSDGIRFTTADINDVKGEVEETVLACNNENDNNLIGRNPFLKKGRSDILESMHSSLVPKTLEKLVKHYFKSIGATWVDMPAGNIQKKEGDADVIAGFDSIKTTIYVQVKHHRAGSETDEWAVEQIRQYRDSKGQGAEDCTTGAWVVSTAEGFSEQAIKEARKEDVQLIDGPTFADMLIRAGIGFEHFEL